ncbi:hypothetical protein M9H77_06966 [Catharanthus roseus]|uniref:Uncharacterized protein n=1 Tax=Catharanthus roseus TaxID=4058 RepID=A0ACC0BTU9_CATRO|nr:hypothetical protein M9H77_06966 [Catharanthus roseus]
MRQERDWEFSEGGCPSLTTHDFFNYPKQPTALKHDKFTRFLIPIEVECNIFKALGYQKTAGSTKNGRERDSKPKNLGVKKFGGEVGCWFVCFPLLAYGTDSNTWKHRCP